MIDSRGGAIGSATIRAVSMFRRRLQQLIALAFLAALGVLVAPVSAQAMRAAADAPWNEVCTTAPDGEPGKAAVVHLHEACVLCAAAQTGAPPPAAPATTAAAPLPALQPLRFLQAPATSHAWAAASPRGPPSAC